MKKNTLDEGMIRCLVYQMPNDNKKIYYATALELNLTVSASDTTIALLDLQEQIKEYIATAREQKASELLNQEVDADLERAWSALIQKEEFKESDATTESLIPMFASTSPIGAVTA